MTFSVLSVFVPTFFLVSLTPGLCMTLALSLGMTVGVRRAGWMMAGEMLGVAVSVIATVIGIAAVLVRYPAIFTVFKWVGGLYLIYLGMQMWRSRGNLAIPEIEDSAAPPPRAQLFGQGLVTAVANPKGWAFDIALLPPFVNFQKPLTDQLSVMLGVILLLELICLLLYATGGSAARRLLRNQSNVRTLNRLAGTLIIGVGIWLAAS